MKDKQYTEPEENRVCCDKGSCTCGANFEESSSEETTQRAPLEFTKEELEMIVSWFYTHDHEGYGDERDNLLFHKIQLEIDSREK